MVRTRAGELVGTQRFFAVADSAGVADLDNELQEATPSRPAEGAEFSQSQWARPPNNQPDVIVRRKDLPRLTGRSVAQVYIMIKENRFPRPVRLGGERATGWFASEIAQWQEQCRRARDREAEHELSTT